MGLGLGEAGLGLGVGRAQGAAYGWAVIWGEAAARYVNRWQQAAGVRRGRRFEQAFCDCCNCPVY